jgi:hypothetical protein
LPCPQVTGADDAVFVGEDGDLHAAAQAESGEDAGHQALGLLENSPFANLFGLREVSRAGWIRAVPGSARLHAVDQLPAGQPFLAFQWIEGGWLLALSVLLIAATIWLVRRRAA